MFKIRLLNWTVPPVRYYYKNVIKSKVQKPVIKHIGEPLITSRRPEFNLHRGDKIDADAALGSIPLATDGWHHYKSKNDFFIIHPHSNEEDVTQNQEYAQPFDRFNLSPELLANLSNRLNIHTTTFIQCQALPKILNNRHTLIAAETGCGKTIAYLLPIIQNVLNRRKTEHANNNPEFNTPKVLIITPSRELAIQIGEVCDELCHGLDLKTKVIIGGHTKSLMLNPSIDEVDILISSIGVLSKLTTCKIYKLHAVRHVVLDEADTLLDDSFSSMLQYILKQFPVKCNVIHCRFVDHSNYNCYFLSFDFSFIRLTNLMYPMFQLNLF